jgi:hypothetical protein
MKRYARYVAAGVAAAALAAGLAACGGSNSKAESTSTSSASATAAWADSLCGALVTWGTAVKASVPKAGSGKLTVDTLKQSATAIADANDTLASDIDDLGKPPTPGAEKAKAAAQHLSDELRSVDKEITDAASSISGPSDVLPAVSKITASLSAMGNDLKTAGTKFESAAGDKNWQKAFSESSSCQKLSSSSG